MLDNITFQLPSSSEVGLSPKTTQVAAHTHLPRHEHYKIFRSYLHHEDELINHRICWNWSIQGFLFATYGFCFQKIAEVNEKIAEFNSIMQPGAVRTPIRYILGSSELQHLTHLVIPLVGFAISFLSLLGTFAARRAINRLERDWKRFVLKVDPEDRRKCQDTLCEEIPFLPNLTGGGAWDAHFFGFWAPLFIPAVFCVAWAYLFLVSRT